MEICVPVMFGNQQFHSFLDVMKVWVIGLSMKAIKYPYALISINILKANDVVYHSKDTDR
jgi:hypothetical protein